GAAAGGGGMDIRARRQRRISGRNYRRAATAAMNDTSNRIAESDLTQAVRRAARQEQFLQVVSAEDAQARFVRYLDLSWLLGESVPLAAALGRVLSTDVVAPTGAPPFARPIVGGFAVVAGCTYRAGASTAPLPG